MFRDELLLERQHRIGSSNQRIGRVDILRSGLCLLEVKEGVEVHQQDTYDIYSYMQSKGIDAAPFVVVASPHSLSFNAQVVLSRTHRLSSVALVAPSPQVVRMYRHFERIYKPSFPIQSFGNIKSASDWSLAFCS